MSRTTLFSVSPEHCENLGGTRNAFLSAMYVWTHIAQEYFGLDGFPFVDEEMQRRVWNATNEHTLHDFEAIVLASTMDGVTVKSKDVPRLITAFEQYAKCHPNSSFAQQAEILKAADLAEGHCVAWCQTSAVDFRFSPEFDEETEQYIYNDLSDAWDLFEQFDENQQH